MSNAKKALPNLLETHPKIASEWIESIDEPELNAALVTYGSNKKILWACSKCSKTFVRAIAERTRISDLPNCSSCKRLTPAKHNSLAFVAPNIAQEWSSINKLKPSEVSFSSHLVVHWKCNKCSGQWQCSINSRTGANKTGCPLCLNRAVSNGVNDLYTKRPDLLSDIESHIDPKSTLTTSKEKIYWLCKKCGASEYLSIALRAKRITSCKSCSLRRVIYGVNDLYTLYPMISDEWSYSKNGYLTPHGVTQYSHLMINWNCSLGHEWRESVRMRVLFNSQCPFCFKRTGVSHWEKEISDFLISYKFAIELSNRSIIAPYELDIVINNKALAIECNGNYWHSDYMRMKMQGLTAEAYHQRKRDLAQNKHYRLLFIWEDDWANSKEEIKSNLINSIEHGIYFDNLNTLTKG